MQQALAAQLRLEPPTTNIKVIYRDPLSGTECVSSIEEVFCMYIKINFENVSYSQKLWELGQKQILEI